MLKEIVNKPWKEQLAMLEEKEMIEITWPPQSGKKIKMTPEAYGKVLVWPSETSRCRDRLAKYCVGNGVDLGYGGDAITSEAITVDLPQPYGAPGWTREHPDPQHLRGDAKHLHWFKNGSLDYVYSSHLFEDFLPKDMSDILLEWLRVLRIDGLLVLYLPDQKKYEKYCKKHNERPNPNHKVKNFGLKFFLSLLKKIKSDHHLEVVHQDAACDDYSFEIVVKKGQWIPPKI